MISAAALSAKSTWRAPQPHQRRRQHQRDRGLDRIGERDRPAPHPHQGEHALDLVPAGFAGFEHDDAGEVRRGKERVPYRSAEGERRDQRQCGDGRSGGSEGRATARCAARTSGNRMSELRLVGDEAEQQAGEHWTAVEAHERGADQGGGEKPVMAVAEIDEHRGKRECEDEPQRIGACPCFEDRRGPTPLLPASGAGRSITIARSARR